MERTAVAILMAAAALHAQGVVQGRVVSSVDGSAVKRAVVTLKGEETYLVRTDGEGRFALQDVVPSRYEVEAARDGYQAKASPSVTVSAGANAALRVQLVPLATIAGRITDDQGDPVADASVEAMHYRFTGGNKQLRANARATTNDRGEYLVADVVPSRYYVRASKPDHDPPIIGGFTDRGPRRLMVHAAAYYPGTRDVNRAAMLDATPGAEVRNVDLRLPQQGVYSISGTTAPGLTAELIRLMNEPGGEYATRKGSSGPFEIWGLTPGSYAVISRRQGELYAMRRVQIANDDVRGVDLTAGTTVAVSGRVEGAPASVRQVVLQSGESPALDVMTSIEGGVFRLNAQPEPYVVRVQGGGAYVQSMKIGDRVIADHRITPGTSTGDVVITVSTAMGQIKGAVVDAGGRPAVGVNVTLVPDQKLPYWGEMARTAVTNGSGAFTIEQVIPGEYRLFAIAGAEMGAALDAELRKPFEEKGTSVRVEADGTVAVKVTVIE